MPVLSDFFGTVEEQFTGRNGVPFNHGGERTYVRRFRVMVKYNTLSSMAVCSHPAIPRPYSIYVSGNGVEYDPWALLVNLSAEQESSGGESDWQPWIVTARYSSELGKMGTPDNPGFPGDPLQANESGAPSNKAGAAGNPELEPPEVEWDWDIVHRAKQYDLDQTPFVNSTGQPLTPAPTFEVAMPVLVVTRSDLSFDIDVAQQYAFAVNDKPFYGYGVDMVLCNPPKAKQIYRGPLQYSRVTYRLRIWVGEPGTTWQPQYIDAGTCRLENTPGAPNQGKPVPIIRGPHAITQPVLLHNGQEKDPRDPKNIKNGVLIPDIIKRRTFPRQDLNWIIKKGFVRPPTKKVF